MSNTAARRYPYGSRDTTAGGIYTAPTPRFRAVP